MTVKSCKEVCSRAGGRNRGPGRSGWAPGGLRRVTVVVMTLPDPSKGYALDYSLLDSSSSDLLCYIHFTEGGRPRVARQQQGGGL